MEELRERSGIVGALEETFLTLTREAQLAPENLPS